MIGLLLKSLISLASLGFTVYLFIQGAWGWGIFFIFITLFFSLFVFKNQHLVMASLHLRQQKMEKARKSLVRIKEPRYLFKSQRAYYYYLMALTHQEQVKMSQTESMLRKALATGLRHKHDKAVSSINLAAVCMQTGRRREAENLLNEAKRLDEKGMMTNYIKDLKKQMGRTTSRNQIRSAKMNRGKKVVSKKRR